MTTTAQDTIGTMTRADLEKLIDRKVRMSLTRPASHVPYLLAKPSPEAFQRLLKARIIQPDAPSALEMLREDRDR